MSAESSADARDDASRRAQRVHAPESEPGGASARHERRSSLSLSGHARPDEFAAASSSAPASAAQASFHERVQHYVRAMSAIEYSVLKATLATPARAPKMKHVQRLVRGTWAANEEDRVKNANEALGALVRVNKLRSAVSALRVLAVTHALAQHGSSAALHPIYERRERLLDETLEAYSSDHTAMARERRRASAEFMRHAGFYEREGHDACATVVAPYAALIRAKAKFHRHFSAFENNYSVDARAEALEDDGIVMSDPLSSVSLCALVAVAGKARRVIEDAAAYVPAIQAEQHSIESLEWIELIVFVARLALREADLAYRAALFVAATLAEEGRLSASDSEKFRVEHEELRACHERASRKAFLRHEPMYALAETAPNFLETNKTDIQEILSANAPAEKHALDPTFQNLMDDGAETAECSPQKVRAGEMPPLIQLDADEDSIVDANGGYNPFGLAPPQDLGPRPGHRRKPSDFDLDAFSAPLEFTPLQSGPASASTYVDPFLSPNAATQTDVDKLAQSFSESMRRPSHSPLNPSKPPLSPVAAARRGDGADFDEIPMSDLEFGRQIGRGAFGEVFRGRYRGTDVAIKRLCVLDGADGDRRALSEFKRELSFLTRLRHRHVVAFMGASTAPPNLCIVMDYCDKGSLYAYLRNANKSLSAFKALKWMSEAAKGLVYLHARDVIHRDFKSGNLFIDDGGSIKIGDFGLSKFHSGASTSAGAMSLVGTYQFMAPELLEGNPRYTTAVDVYSFGVVMWECLTREEPFAGFSLMQIVAALLRGERPTSSSSSSSAAANPPPDLPKEYAEIMRACWCGDPSARPAIDAVAPELERMFLAEKRRVVAAKKAQDTADRSPSLMP